MLVGSETLDRRSCWMSVPATRYSSISLQFNTNLNLPKASPRPQLLRHHLTLRFLPTQSALLDKSTLGKESFTDSTFLCGLGWSHIGPWTPKPILLFSSARSATVATNSIPRLGKSCIMVSYDPDSGQVYREWTISNPSKTPVHQRDWSRARPTATQHAPGKEVPSLLSMTTRVVAMNIGDMVEEHLDRLPSRVRLRVWQFLEARYVRSLDSSVP